MHFKIRKNSSGAEYKITVGCCLSSKIGRLVWLHLFIMLLHMMFRV